MLKTTELNGWQATHRMHIEHERVSPPSNRPEARPSFCCSLGTQLSSLSIRGHRGIQAQYRISCTSAFHTDTMDLVG